MTDAKLIIRSKERNNYAYYNFFVIRFIEKTNGTFYEVYLYKYSIKSLGCKKRQITVL